ncbi:MAG TPA: hypothetical protein VJL87_02200 [Bdellovibrionota bacterium]|nr:hypothetical protein [Bdellovibrionota bacterium]
MAKLINPEKLFDIRVVARNLQKQLLSEDDYQKFLASLPDDADEGEPVRIEEEEQIQ